MAIKVCEFYLKEAGIREQTAKNGHLRVLNEHTYEHRLREILGEGALE